MIHIWRPKETRTQMINRTWYSLGDLRAVEVTYAAGTNWPSRSVRLFITEAED